MRSPTTSPCDRSVAVPGVLRALPSQVSCAVGPPPLPESRVLCRLGCPALQGLPPRRWPSVLPRRDGALGRLKARPTPPRGRPRTLDERSTTGADPDQVSYLKSSFRECRPPTDMIS